MSSQQHYRRLGAKLVFTMNYKKLLMWTAIAGATLFALIPGVNLGYTAFVLDYHGDGALMPIEKAMPRLAELREQAIVEIFHAEHDRCAVIAMEKIAGGADSGRSDDRWLAAQTFDDGRAAAGPFGNGKDHDREERQRGLDSDPGADHARS